MEILTSVGLADDADKRVAKFSKSMKIRLNVARSLLYQPRLLFLDEPTSGLDPVNARNISKLPDRSYRNEPLNFGDEDGCYGPGTQPLGVVLQLVLIAILAGRFRDAAYGRS